MAKGTLLPGSRILAAMLSLLLLLGMSAAALAQGEDTLGVVYGGRLHLREAPDKDSRIIATYGTGTHVKVLSVTGRWYRVLVTDGRTGYMDAAHIFISNVGRVENGSSYVNLRSAPSRNARVIGRYGSGTLARLISENGAGWLFVDIGGVRGYMSASFIKTVPEEQAGRAFLPAVASVDISAPHTLPLGNSQDAVQQIGEANTEAYSDSALTYSIRYPYLGVGAVDMALGAWIADTVEAIHDTAAGADAPVSLLVEFDSYLINNRYAGILETGYIDSSIFAHPSDVVHTLNADLQGETLLTYREIFTSDHIQTVLDILRDKLNLLEGDPVAEAHMDESWLAYTLLTPEGVTIVLPRGEFLASALGTLGVSIAYETLASFGALALDITADEAPTAMAPGGAVG